MLWKGIAKHVPWQETMKGSHAINHDIAPQHHGLHYGLFFLQTCWDIKKSKMEL